MTCCEVIFTPSFMRFLCQHSFHIGVQNVSRPSSQKIKLQEHLSGHKH